MLKLESLLPDFIVLAETHIPNYGNWKKVKHFHDLSVELQSVFDLVIMNFKSQAKFMTQEDKI